MASQKQEQENLEKSILKLRGEKKLLESKNTRAENDIASLRGDKEALIEQLRQKSSDERASDLRLERADKEHGALLRQTQEVRPQVGPPAGVVGSCGFF